jgi:hypothetical protein
MQHPYNFANLKAFILLLTLFLKKKKPKTNTQCKPETSRFFSISKISEEVSKMSIKWPKEAESWEV